MNTTPYQRFQDTVQQLDTQYTGAEQQLLKLKNHVQTTDWNEDLAVNVIDQLAVLREMGVNANSAFRELDSETQNSSQVQTQIRSVAEKIQRLLATIDQLENSARQSRDQLLPQINASVRAFQMHKAYSAQALQ